MKEIFELCILNNITPNQLYLLYCIRERIRSKGVNINVELRLLQKEWLTTDNKLNDKSINLLKKAESIKSGTISVAAKDFEDNVKKYRELFPKGRLPSGKQGRQSERELQGKFIKFFDLYGEYTWDTILKATRNYVNEFQEPYMYMSCSSFFITKQDKYKDVTSQLADYCEAVLAGDEPEEQHYEQKMI